MPVPSPPTPAAVADLSGRQLGDLRLLRRLGRGAMAEVYLAEQCRLKRRVAVKILKPALAEDHTYLKRFEREAQAAASLVHANIVQIHEVGHGDGLHYIVQEYVAGLNLRQWIARYGPADLGRAVSIMRQTAAGLAKAADEGVVHRDIKPENIMLTPAGEVKVADFGLARLAGDTQTTDLTQIGMTLGTPLYMSPEQVEGKPLDCRSDLYSFGVTCYHMLSGNPPFVGETALGVAVQHLKREPPPLETLRPDLPPALCRIVHKMLVKDPAGRWQSPRELLRELRRVQQEYCAEGAGEESGVWESSATMPADPRLEASRQLAAVMKSAAAERRRGGRGCWRWACWGRLPSAAPWPGSACGRSRCWRSPAADTCGSPASRPRWPSIIAPARSAPKKPGGACWNTFPRRNRSSAAPSSSWPASTSASTTTTRRWRFSRSWPPATDADKEYRAWGLAGKVGVLTLEGKYRESADVLDDLWPIRGELRDEQMKKLLDHCHPARTARSSARKAGSNGTSG